MRNNKGFTLIELIVTIALLSIVSVISFVSINGVIQKSKNTNCNDLVNNIKSAAKEYVSDNRYKSSVGTSTTAKQLIDDNYLNGPIIDPYNSDSELEASKISISWTLNTNLTLNKFGLITYNGKEITCNDKLTD